jgi:hypothetical protein
LIVLFLTLDEWFDLPLPFIHTMLKLWLHAAMEWVVLLCMTAWRVQDWTEVISKGHTAVDQWFCSMIRCYVML